MTALPLDVTRCRPASADNWCRNCKRWADHPEQVIGHVTSLVNATDSRDPACQYVPVSLQPAHLQQDAVQ